MALTLDPLTTAYVNARIEATTAAASGVLALLPSIKPYAASGYLAAGRPAIADPGFLEWGMTFNAESAPTALPTSGVLKCAYNGVLPAWQNVINAIQVVEGVPFLDYRYDTAVRTWRVSNLVAQKLNDFYSGNYPNYSLNAAGELAWNNAVAYPSIMMAAAVIMSAPNSLGQQQASVVRYVLDNVVLTLSQLLLSLRSPTASIPNFATLNIGQSLQDLAARQTGNFENWIAIANLNGISPPYPGASNTAMALKGAQLLLPATSGVTASGAPVPSYEANILGTDWDFGPINGNLPPWLGDIPLITGYLNFSRAIGRRLQTPLNALIYHSKYGSRIPPEVGAVQGANEAARLARLGDSAVQADPRTGSIVRSKATTQPGFLATYEASIQPIGPGATPVNVNETISPLP
jgi:hypothetical protein